MSVLVAGADGTLIDPSDREAVIAAAEQVPGIEDADINDGWLIENTQTLDAGPGMMKYKIVLPDGSPLECTPFQIEHRRDMSKVWMATVRAQILAKAQEAAAITREQQLKARREKQLAGGGIQVAGQIPTREEAAALAAAVKPPPPAPPEHARQLIQAVRAETRQEPTPSADPQEYAQQAYDSAMAEFQHWNSLSVKAARNAKAAHKAALKWKTMVEAFSDENEQETEVVESVGKVSETRAGKLARTLQTSAATKGISGTSSRNG